MKSGSKNTAELALVNNQVSTFCSPRMCGQFGCLDEMLKLQLPSSLSNSPLLVKGVCDQAHGESAGGRAGWFLIPGVLRPVDTLRWTYIEALMLKDQAQEACMNVWLLMDCTHEASIHHVSV